MKTGIFKLLILASALIALPCRAEWVFNKLFKLDSVPNGVSISDDGSVGYVVTYEGNCFEFKNRKNTRKIHVTDGICQDVAYAPKADKGNVWIIDSNNDLIIGTVKKDSNKFATAYKFNSQANAIGLSADGRLGFIAEEDGTIDEFIDGKFSKKIEKIDVPITALISTYDGRKLWFITVRDELYEGVCSPDGKWEFSVIYKFKASQSDVAMSADGSEGFIVSSGGTISYFRDGKFVDIIKYKVPDGAVAVTSSADGRKIWLTTGDFSLIEGVKK